jgi:hypothetical protein
MKPLAVFAIVLSFVAVTFSQQKGSEQRASHSQDESSVLMYRDGAGFFIDVPKGWVVDKEIGKRLGGCCVFYPRGTTWDNAETVLYPNIATKRKGQQTLAEFMTSDLADFRRHDPAMTYEDAEDVSLKNNRIAKVRLFYGVNGGSSEAVAYVDEDEIIVLVVLSSKTKKGLNESMPLLRSALETYVYMNVQKPGKPAPFQLPKD